MNVTICDVINIDTKCCVKVLRNTCILAESIAAMVCALRKKARAVLTGHVAGSPSARHPGDIWLRRAGGSRHLLCMCGVCAIVVACV